MAVQTRLALLAALAASAPAWADSKLPTPHNSPEGLIMAIYLAYEQKGDVWEPSEQDMAAMFTPALRATMKTAYDAVQEDGDYFTPFYTGQDGYPSQLTLSTSMASANDRRAIVRVSYVSGFPDDGEAESEPANVTRERVNFILLKTAQGWRIDEAMISFGASATLIPYSQALRDREHKIDWNKLLASSVCTGEFGAGSGTAGSSVGACQLVAQSAAEHDVQVSCQPRASCEVHGRLARRNGRQYITDVWEAKPVEETK